MGLQSAKPEVESGLHPDVVHFTALRLGRTGLRSWGPCIAPSSSLDLGDVGEDCLSPGEALAARLGEFHSRRGQTGSTG